MTCQPGTFYIRPGYHLIIDNSSDPQGPMMLINADYEPGLFYEEDISGLCGNTLYEFSADVINLVRNGVSDHQLPRLVFLIDDTDAFSTDDIAQDEQCNKYGFTFTTSPGETRVKLSIRNDAPGGSGNDLALDHISFQAIVSVAFTDRDQTIFLCEADNLASDSDS